MNNPLQRLDKFDLEQKLTNKGDSSSLDFMRFLRQLGQIVNFQGRLAVPTAQTVTASPFVYTNNSGNDQSEIVSGGTVSLIEYSRNGGTYIPVGAIGGMFALSPLDSLRVTYTVIPTITVVVR